ncbi:MAG: hypothetical protein V4819_12090 [Verrucomicrobiota bacterium]
MNPRLATAAIWILAAGFAAAQNVADESKSDPVLDALQEFEKRDKDKPNEVTVVLDGIGQPLAPAPEPTPSAEQSPPAEPPKAVIVSGKPPEGIDLASEPTPPEAIAAAPDEAPPKPTDGLAVSVEKLHTGKGSIDPSEVKLFAPFPAKPLAQPPAGWHLDASSSAQPFTREVELAPGTTITLTIRPHLLVPDADGATVFTIPEPGFDNKLGYAQTATVGANLSNSIRRLDEDSKQLGAAIDSLQQLLVSLPKPEPKPEPQPEGRPANSRKK